MTLAVVFMIIFATVAAIALFTAFIARDSDNKALAVVVAVGAVLLTGAVAFMGSIEVVGTRQIGVVTSFNRPTGESMSNGFHFKAPWKEVHEMDAAVQIDTYQKDNKIDVRLGNNSTAHADASIRWQIKPEAASELFVQYKSFDGVKANLIERNLKVALNEAFAEFDPLNKKNLEESPLPRIADNALKLLRDKVGEQVEILDVSVPTIEYSPETEKRINEINEERARTTAAAQQVQTNEQKRKAAEELAKMPPPDLKIAIANCLNKMAETGQNLNCFPIGTGVVPTLEVPSPLK